jgi:predicted aspartyl protease
MKHLFLLLFFTNYVFAFDKSVEITKDRETFYLNAVVQNEQFNMLLDTGSSFVVLTHNPGLKPKRKIIAILADGRRFRTEVYIIPEIVIDGCILRNVDAIIINNGVNILGMTALHKMSPVTMNMLTGNLIFECGRYSYNPIHLHCRGCSTKSYRNF